MMTHVETGSSAHGVRSDVLLPLVRVDGMEVNGGINAIYIHSNVLYVGAYNKADEILHE